MKFTRNRRGFTLIETVIVLSLAGVIILLVFLAVGGAQRANRDSRRTTEAGLIAAAIDAYAMNNGGSYPKSTDAYASYFASINDVDTDAAPQYSIQPVDAKSGEHFAVGYVCDGDAMTPGKANNYAVLYWSEQGGVGACKDNSK